jgi:ankyrin repeat protein
MKMKTIIALLILIISPAILSAQIRPAEQRLSANERHFQKLVAEQTVPMWLRGIYQMKKTDTLTRLDSLLSGSDIGADIKGAALMQAAAVGEVELVQLLIRKGTDVNYRRPEDGQTVLMVAAVYGFSVQCGNDPLVESYSGNTEIVQALLNAGARPDDQDNFGNTALMLAASQGRNSSVGLILEAGANANLRNKDGATALISAASNTRACNNLKTIVAALIANGAELNARDDKCKTALSYATGCEALRKLLIDAGAIE